MSELLLTDLIDVSMLQKIQDGFSRYTNMAAVTTDANGTPVTEASGFTDFCSKIVRKTELGCKRCFECDKQGALLTLENGGAVSYYCHAGLVDFAAPIMVNGKVIGSFVGGQVRSEPIDEKKMRAIAAELGIDGDLYVREAEKAVQIDKGRIQRAAEFLTELAGVLSEMAYTNYVALEKSRKLERVARSQTAFMVEMNANLRKNVRDWMQTANRFAEGLGNQVLENAFEELKTKGAEFLQSIEETVEYAKITDGDIELNEDIYDVRELLKRAADRASVSCENTDIRFEVRVDDSVPEKLFGDAGRITQMINKLLSNSVNFTKHGLIRLEASCIKQSYATMLKIVITDSGRGMTENELQKVTSLLEQSSAQYDRDNIGINIIGMLSRQMSGHVEVSGKPDEGTRFTIVLPQLEINEEGGQ